MGEIIYRWCHKQGLNLQNTETDHTTQQPENKQPSQSASAIILRLPSFENLRNKYILFISDPVCGILLQQLKLTKTGLWNHGSFLQLFLFMSWHLFILWKTWRNVERSFHYRFLSKRQLWHFHLMSIKLLWRSTMWNTEISIVNLMQWA